MRISDLNQDGVGLDGIDPVAAANGELLKGNPATGSFTNDVSAQRNDEYPMTNRVLEDEEFAMETQVEDEPGFGEQEPDDEDLAKTNLYEGE